ncbi:asparagine--tRNA ligase [Candidatus Epulonipiscium fishelsonii]|uniref:Asparagine--tRNA ligase n=1 Tax=Candidatus Epulonipiscium fishelsonii TaxID=77094 RepID=A0ACC8XCP3_9FIRM|nr:asparagine--tRNA ligase [Epulopiscium sp. SCG-B11WGA-EpuloA1]ONI41366.1 asparagine--tRNA ligase [Epulopiscium sp. SCG-B05WGA-EpuloA1]
MIMISVRKIYKDTEQFTNEKVTIGGWVRSLRDSKTFGFIDLNDGTFFKGVQIVFDDSIENFKEITKVGVGTALIIEGTLILTPNQKQPFEIKATSIEVEGECPPDYPLQKKRHSMEFLREIAYLRPRTNTFSAVFRVRSLAAYAIHKFFQERNFVYAHTPIITASDCEGAGEMFTVTTLDLKKPKFKEDGEIDFKEDFFGKMASLTVSGQLSAETFALAFKDAYTFGPTFRAENSNTPRHAAEFWMIEPEIAFADLNDDMNLAEDMLKFIINYVLENAPEEIKFFDSFVSKGILQTLNNDMNADFGRVTYTEAIEILEKSGKSFEYPVYWGCDLQTEHEKFLSQEYFKRPVFVIDYPKEIKAFYMRLNDDKKTVAAMDLLVPAIGELIGGSQREERLDVLQSRLAEFGLNEDDYWWYLNLRKFGGTRHAGFGLGFERLVMYLTGITNIRDVIPFPRTVGKADF